MEKTIYYRVESNGDLSATVNNIETAAELIKGDMESQDDLDDLVYTIMPILLTQEEYDALPEME